jgi:hypothetical protein
MVTEDSHNAVQRASPRPTSWLAWLAAILVLLVALGYFVVKPLVEKAIEGAGTMVVGLLAAAAQAAKVPYDMACRRVEQSDEVKALVGKPIRCASFEKSEWLDASDRNELEFKFQFTGPKGAGEAHAVAVATETGFQLKSVDVTGPAADVTRLVEP